MQCAMAIRPLPGRARIRGGMRWSAALMAATLLPGVALAGAPGAGRAWAPLDQGTNWTDEERTDFYSRDQGSRIMPLRWIVALKQRSGAPFLADSLSRYGYLPNEASVPSGLPVGFVATSSAYGEMIGMTCAACHTRQLVVQGTRYRVDGGPAIVDFQAFLSDLDFAVTQVLAAQAAFDAFSRSVLGPTANDSQKAALRKDLEDWYLPFHTIVDKGLPAQPWGLGRLDAVTMIFNRLTGLDIGPAPTYIIEKNIQRADAPVRYPFLWNAARQDLTQWPGFADNGNALLGLSRNLGEVTGVFATYHPTKDAGRLFGIDFTTINSSNFAGLAALERMIKKIGPPKWPWSINGDLVKQGRQLFNDNCAKGCHEVKEGKFRSPIPTEQLRILATPVQYVHTDTREWSILGREVDPGVLTGVQVPGLPAPLKSSEEPLNVLKLSVIGAIIQHALPVDVPQGMSSEFADVSATLSPENAMLEGAFHPVSTATKSGSYESRVLQGIWAAAPYLHNGSVATLADLLNPSSQRKPSFPVGPEFDPVDVGLAPQQPDMSDLRQTVDCDQNDSGNSRCGHEFGTTLSPSQKKALVEYLKTL